MGKKEYTEKLKDPRWQKKRLEILERDEWTCQSCFDKGETLNIHHKIYNNRDPWDIDNDFLITLCESCHEHEKQCVRDNCKKLSEIIKRNFLSDEILTLSYAFDEIKIVENSILMSSAIYYLLSDEKRVRKLVDEYISSVGATNGGKKHKN